ncbi:MAG: TolC family protein [Bacteroidaceae bacterium]|nr:TolC family protein [Bacteroidaceae bacterium]
MRYYSIRIRMIAALAVAMLAQVASAGTVLTLQECRDLALDNNKQSLIAQERVNAAEYDRRAAVANYLPKVSATGAYLRNSDNISLISADQAAMLSGLGSAVGSSLGNSIGSVMQGLMASPTIGQMLASDPQLAGLFAQLQQSLPDKLAGITEGLNAIGSELAESFELDIQNVYVGMVSVEEPLYVGGKIRAYNKVTQLAKELAEIQLDGEDQKVLVTTDEAYWQVVSIANKLRLAEKYAEVLRKLDSDVEKMKAEGVATASDQLAVRVELNQAEMTLVKAQNGLALSKMLLCQLIGMDLHSDITLADEENTELVVADDAIEYTDETIQENRVELRSLQLAAQMYGQKVNIVRADYLPTVALMGAYSVTNPSSFNGFENKFGGMLSAGVVARIPLFHFGEGVNKVRRAQSDALIAQYQLEEAKGKVSLQVTQYEHKIEEAEARLAKAEKLIENAEENQRIATIGFQEGVVESATVLKAQTAWLQAKSEEVDARIDRIMAGVYLRQATGLLK